MKKTVSVVEEIVRAAEELAADLKLGRRVVVRKVNAPVPGGEKHERTRKKVGARQAKLARRGRRQ